MSVTTSRELTLRAYTQHVSPVLPPITVIVDQPGSAFRLQTYLTPDEARAFARELDAAAAEADEAGSAAA